MRRININCKLSDIVWMGKKMSLDRENLIEIIIKEWIKKTILLKEEERELFAN